MKIEPLSRDIYARFEGEAPPVTISGLAITDDENVLGVIGVASFNGEKFITCGIKPHTNKRLIIKAWHQFKEKFMRQNRSYYALVDQELKTAPGLLKHFGFEYLKENIYIYRG